MASGLCLRPVGSPGSLSAGGKPGCTALIGRPSAYGDLWAHFGSALTSVSHFCSRRFRSAEDPYLAKS
jgi:hypothetical protein